MNFNFQVGKKRPDKKQLIIVGIVLSTIIGGLSQCTKISENRLWDLLDEIQRKYFPESVVGDVIRQDPEKIERRVIRDVDKAIADYNRKIGDTGQVKLPSPLYSEKDGVMRLCSPWVEGCEGIPIDKIEEQKLEFNLEKRETDKLNIFNF